MDPTDPTTHHDSGIAEVPPSLGHAVVDAADYCPRRLHLHRTSLTAGLSAMLSAPLSSAQANTSQACSMSSSAK
jgi:hypothetical protein